jgi:hypothetical protein
VLELRVSITHQAGEEALEIGSYGRVGVFLHDEARRGVTEAKPESNWKNV